MDNVGLLHRRAAAMLNVELLGASIKKSNATARPDGKRAMLNAHWQRVSEDKFLFFILPSAAPRAPTGDAQTDVRTSSQQRLADSLIRLLTN